MKVIKTLKIAGVPCGDTYAGSRFYVQLFPGDDSEVFLKGKKAVLKKL